MLHCDFYTIREKVSREDLERGFLELYKMKSELSGVIIFVPK